MKKGEILDRKTSVAIIALVIVSVIGILAYSEIFRHPNDNSSPIFSAASESILDEKILFETSSQNQCALKTVSTEGVTSEIIKFQTPNPGYHDFCLSPDGRRVAYFSPDDYLTVVEIDSGKTTRLVKMSQEAGLRETAWSFDLSKIAYVNDDALYVINVNGSGNRKLVESEGASYHTLGYLEGYILGITWSLDGERILYDTFTAPQFLFGGSQFDVRNRKICAVNVTSAEVEMLRFSARIYGPGPDDKILIWDYIDENDEDEEGWLLMSDEGLIYTDYEWVTDGKWSPDGDAMAYVFLWDTLEVRDEVTGEYSTLEVAKGEVNDLVWSPDGSHIAYVIDHDEMHIVRRDLTHDFCVVEGLGAGEGSVNVKLIAWIGA